MIIFEKRVKEKQVEAAMPAKNGIYTATDLLNMEIKDIPKLWEPFFPSKGLVGLTGSSDCGKSMLLRQLAIAVVLQKDNFLGYPLHTKYGSALYVCTEDDLEGTAANLSSQIGNVDRQKVSNLKFVFDTNDLVKRLDGMLTEMPADVVILDTWSDTFIGNPNSWVDIRQNLSQLKTLYQKHGCLIVIIHHTVKNSEKNAPDKNKLNGSQAIEAKLRSLLELRNGTNADERLLYVLKSNYIPKEYKAEGLLLEINPKRLLFNNTGQKVPIQGFNGNAGKRIYDPTIWVPRMEELRNQELSFDKAWHILVENYGAKEVPGLTWFKNQAVK
jgi:hypothetical protein